MKPIPFLLLALLCFAASRANANGERVALPNLEPSLAKRAAELGYPLTGECSDPFEGEFRAGDELTYIVELRETEQRRQWLVRMAWQSKDGKKGKSVTRYASSGDVFSFSTDKGVVTVSTLGFVVVGTPSIPDEVSQTIQVEKDFLKMGFFDNSAFWNDVWKRKFDEPSLPDFWFYTNTSPVDPGIIETQKKLMETYGVSTEQLRVASAAGVTFNALMEQLSKTPGVSKILWQVAEKPSALSLLSGLRSNVSNYDPDMLLDIEHGTFPFAMPYNSGFYNVRLNGEDAMRLDIYAAPSTGVMTQAAGVIALAARPPEGGKDQLLVVALCGARRVAEE